VSRSPSAQPAGLLSRRALEELSVLQANVHRHGTLRATALRLLVASRHAATAVAQREFWLEFAWADQEYRVAVRRLAQFCERYRHGSRRSLRMYGGGLAGPPP
jgi:hypothetical protein